MLAGEGNIESFVDSTNEIRRLWVEMKDKDLFKGLRICKPEQRLGNTNSDPKKKEKSRVLIVKSTFLRRISPGLVLDANPLDDQ